MDWDSCGLILDDLTVQSFLCRPNSGRREDPKGGEETIFASKAQLPTDRRRVEREENYSIQ